jgi:hypothetical protein
MKPPPLDGKNRSGVKYPYGRTHFLSSALDAFHPMLEHQGGVAGQNIILID